MATRVDFQVIGAEEIERRLAALPAKIEKRVYRTAMKATASKLRTKIRRVTPRDTGRARAKGVKIVTRVNRYDASVWVGYRGGGRGTARIMRFYQAGSMGSRKQPNRVQVPRPFFHRAVAGWREEALSDFQKALVAAVEKNEG